MEDHNIYNVPEVLASISAETEALGFNMASEPRTGALLRTLAASKPNSRFLELGTGTGLSAAWIFAGMDESSTLVTVDNDAEPQGVARKYLSSDSRIEFVCEDGEKWLEKNQNSKFDFIFADAWPGKFSNLDLALNILSIGGIYLIDDLFPQKSWPEGHAPKVPALLKEIENRDNLTSVRIGWASGLMLVTRTQ